MKVTTFLFQNPFQVFFLSLFPVLLSLPNAQAQKFDIDKSIEKHRKGKIIVKANPDSEIIIEQLSHEFWFGCAIGDAIFDGRASDSDVKQYKEKFLLKVWTDDASKPFAHLCVLETVLYGDPAAENSNPNII